MPTSSPSRTVCIAGAVLTLIFLPASLTIGFGTLLLNLLAIGCFVAPLVMEHRERETPSQRRF